MNKKGIIILTLILLVLAVAGYAIYKPNSTISTSVIPVSDFEGCVTAGYPIMETYPRGCKTPGGELFIEKVNGVSNENNHVVPINTTSKVEIGYVAGNVTVGPICPVERVDHPCVPSPETYTSKEAVVYGSDGITVKNRTRLDSKGNYKISLAPGNYYIEIVPGGMRQDNKKSITIRTNQTTVANFDIDTGIR